MSSFSATPLGEMSFSPRSARELAYRVLERHRQTGVWVQDELAGEFTRGFWSSADRRLVTELVCGVIRRQATLTALLQPAVTRPWEKIEPELVTLLWLGAYQLLYLDRIPPFAAIHETVELARSMGQTRWTGFANGIFRSLTRGLTEEWTDQPGSDAVPVSPGRYRKMSIPVFPDLQTHWAGYVAAAYSFPEWLAQKWAARFPREQLIAIAEASNASPHVYVRVNRRRTTPEALQTLWANAGIRSERCTHPDALQLLEGGQIDQLPGYGEGFFSPQDLTAMTAAGRLAPGPDDRVWDMCAAPGTKSCHLAELRDDHGSIVATDVHGGRLAFVGRGAQRLGLTSICTTVVRDDLTDLPQGPFDAILLDAPCSNTGVLHRRPEARWRLQPYDFVELPKIQLRLLEAGLQRLAPGGRLLYSTCSIEPEENEQVVSEVCRRHDQLEVISQQVFLPGKEGDGGFQALLRRGSTA